MTTHPLLGVTLSVLLWAIVVRRSVRPRTFTSLWWSAVALAVVSTLRLQELAVLLDQQLRVPLASVGLAHVALVAAVGLTVRWLLTVHYGTAGSPWRRPAALTTLVVAVLMATSWGAHVLAPTAVRSRTALLIHDLTFAGYLLTSTTIAVISAAAIFTISNTRHRVSLGCIIGAAGFLWLFAATSSCRRLAAMDAPPLSVPAVPDGLITLSLVLLTCALGLPLLPYAPQRRDLTSERTLRALWRWLSPHAPPLAIDELAEHGGIGIADAASALLDRIWTLQHWVSPSQLEAATASARTHGLTKRRATLVGTVDCLEHALRVEREKAPPRARFARLLPSTGSGRLEPETRWLAELAAVRGLATPRPDERIAMPAIPALADPELLVRCQAHLERWLPGQRPATMPAIVRVIGRKLGRPIHMVIGDSEGLPMPIAVWIGTVRGHLIWVDRHTTPMQRTIGLMHEIGHIICGHQPRSVAPRLPNGIENAVETLPGGSPRAERVGYRGREALPSLPGCRTPDKLIEAEAELTGRLLATHLLYAPDAALAVYLDVG